MPKKVLIVDDDRTMNSLLKTLLELDGFVVVMVTHGEKVLPLALAERPDAVLMDVHIAEADGMEVLRQIRRHPDLQRLPVVMSSGMDVERECRASGADAFILKPYPPDELSSTLKRVIA
ncbi:MAG: response regulator [Anaerolineales bacterium]|nr:response regulator [Anaerolineales bacterium]